MRVLQLFLSLILLTTTCFGQYLKPIRGMPFVNRTHRLGRGLVGLWLMNEGSGNKVFDLSGNGNTGTFEGTTPSWTAGKFGSAILLPAGGTLAAILLSNTVLTDTAFTKIAWVKLNPSAARRCIMSGGSGSTRGTMELIGSGDIFRYYGYGLSTPGWHEGGSITEGVWTQLVVTYQTGIGLAMYVNGLQTLFVGGITGYGGDTVYIGRYTSYYFDGLIDHVMIYNRALSVSEIAELYAKSFGMFQKDNTALIASVTAPPPPGGQVIMIQMSMIPLFLIFTLVCFIRGKES